MPSGMVLRALKERESSLRLCREDIVSGTESISLWERVRVWRLLRHEILSETVFTWLWFIVRGGKTKKHFALSLLAVQPALSEATTRVNHHEERV